MMIIMTAIEKESIKSGNQQDWNENNASFWIFETELR